MQLKYPATCMILSLKYSMFSVSRGTMLVTRVLFVGPTPNREFFLRDAGLFFAYILRFLPMKVDFATVHMYGLRMRHKQLDLFLQNKKNPDPFFGGSNLKSNPKVARPISTKDFMHVVLKSDHAKGPLSFLRIERVLISLVQNLGDKLNVKVKDVVVMTNHIHLAIKVRHRRHFKAYLRALTGLIVRKLLKTERSKPAGFEKFFKGRPFSRIVNSGRKSFGNLMRYFELNRLEKCGYSKAESRAEGLVYVVDFVAPIPAPI